MRRVPIQVLIVSICLASALPACQALPPTEAITATLPSTSEPRTLETVATNPAVASAPPPTTENTPNLQACDHLLWPLRNGATWTYQLTEGGVPSEVTLAASIKPDGALLTQADQTRNINCIDGALSGLPPLWIGHPDLGNAIDGDNPSGDYLPSPDKLLPLGSATTWDIQLDAKGTVNVPSSGGSMSLPIVSGKLAMIHSSGALETVNVPAGTFDAVPVHEEALFDLRVHYPDGTDQGIVINCESLLYFSENVGPVKIDYLGGTISTSGASWPLAAGVTLELIRYNLPDH